MAGRAPEMRAGRDAGGQRVNNPERFQLSGGVQGGAVFSADRTLRFELRRTWADLPDALFIGLNPSTADETKDDPTIRRCIRFAKDWNCGGILMMNLFAFRSTDPAGIQGRSASEGDNWIKVADQILHPANSIVIFCWGVNQPQASREFLKAMAATVHIYARDRCHHLGLTKDGHPKHPLYLRSDTKPVRWNWSQYIETRGAGE